MKINKRNTTYLPLLTFLLLFLSSCSSVGLLSEDNRFLPQEIDSFGDFLSVYIVLQISIFLIAVLLSFIIGRGGNFVSLILHFIWVVAFRDYGFLMVLLLFGLFTILSYAFSFIRTFMAAKKYND